jgi:hypothetical protein
MRTLSRNPLRIALVVVCVLYSSAGRAAPPPSKPAPAPVVRDAADDWFDKGSAAYEAHKLKEAAAAFLEAWKLKKTQDTAANLGTIELELHEARKAAEHLDYAVRHGAPTDSDAARRAARDRFEQARKLVGAIRVKVNVAGASVYLNGELVGVAPIEGDVFADPGTTAIEAKLAGYDDARAVVQVDKGSSQDASLALLRSEENRRSIAPTIALGAGAAVFLAGGIASALLSNSRASDANAQLAQLQAVAGIAPCKSATVAQDCATLHSLNTSSDTFHNLAVAGFAAAGVTGAAALTYALWPARKGEPRSGLRLAPIVGGSTRGLAASGSF